MQKDVDEGRKELNYSDWGRRRQGEKLDELLESIRENKMPLRSYLFTHPEARLNNAQKQALADGFTAMLKSGRKTAPIAQ